MPFKVGDIIRVLHREGGLNGIKCGELAVVDTVSKVDCGNSNVYWEYGISSRKDGSGSAWWREESLEFVASGGQEEIERLHKVKKETTKKHQNIEYIKREMAKDHYTLSAASVLTLFNKIGYDSRFNRTGEYAHLQSEWFTLSPVFEAIFRGQYDAMIDAVNKAFLEEYREEYRQNATTFFNEMNQN